MKKKKIGVIIIGIIFIVWSLVTLYNFVVHTSGGIASANPIARHNFALNQFKKFIPYLSIWIIILGLLILFTIYYKEEKVKK